MKRSIAGLAIAAVLLAGCASSTERAKGSSEVLRLGIFPNLTHAPGYVAIGAGIFDEVMGPTSVEVTVFNSGTEAGEALIAGSIDATYIGPVPAATLYQRSGGRVALVSGAVSGGASLVVRRGAGIDGPEDLHGKRIAVPSLGNTQDIALRAWLEQNGLQTRDEGGDVSVLEIENPELPQAFTAGDVDAAWEPEPYPSLLIESGLADELVDEATLWSEGRFATTGLLASTVYMEEHPEVIRRLVQANVEAIQMLNEEPMEAKRIAQAQLIEAGAPSLDQSVVDRAWNRLEFTYDPIASSVAESARHAFELGYLDEDPAELDGLFRLGTLQMVLAQQHLEPITVIP